jgi:hypothetical protein
VAGRGPAPKQGRRRRNAPLRGDWVDLAPLEQPVLGELPELPGEVWREPTVAVWEAWRSDPVSAQWSAADVAFALDTITLHNAMTASSASEVRLRMDALGLTPKGKRDLRWRLVGQAESVRAKPLAAVRQLRAV